MSVFSCVCANVCVSVCAIIDCLLAMSSSALAFWSFIGVHSQVNISHRCAFMPGASAGRAEGGGSCNRLSWRCSSYRLIAPQRCCRDKLCSAEAIFEINISTATKCFFEFWFFCVFLISIFFWCRVIAALTLISAWALSDGAQRADMQISRSAPGCAAGGKERMWPKRNAVAVEYAAIKTLQ